MTDSTPATQFTNFVASLFQLMTSSYDNIRQPMFFTNAVLICLLRISGAAIFVIHPTTFFRDRCVM